MGNLEKKEGHNPPERISMKLIYRSIMEALNLERGIFFTIIGLSIRPGETIREYLYQDRTRLVPPLRLLIILVTLATIATISFLTKEDFIANFQQGANMNGGMPKAEEMDPKLKEFVTLYMNNMAVANLKFFNIYLMLGVPLAALGTLIMYRRREYNFAEHLVINAYIYSNTTVLYLLFTPLFFLFSYQTISLWYMIAALPYYCFCCYQVFAPKGWSAIFRSFLTYVLQGIFVVILTLIISLVIALITAVYGIEMKMG
jgi:hypothetical protein